MDPFTEKLLARTQARKAALSNKREEVAKRSPAVNSPRRPLAENNSTPTTSKLTQSISNTPNNKCTPVVVTTAQFAGGTPKSVFYEKYSKQASLRQKECFIELEDAKCALRSTTAPKKDVASVESKASQFVNNSEDEKKGSRTDELKENNQKSSLTATTDSPSVKARKAMFLKQVKVDSTPSKTNIKEDQENRSIVNKTNPEKVFPSIKEPRASLAGGRFFNDPRNSEIDKTPAKPREKKETQVPVKPPRITAPPKNTEPEQGSEPSKSNDLPTKPLQSVNQVTNPPLKPPRVQVAGPSSNDPKLSEPVVNSNNVKRKAPSPPESDDSSKQVNMEVKEAEKNTVTNNASVEDKETKVVKNVEEKRIETPKKKPSTKTELAQEVVEKPSITMASPANGGRKATKRCEKEITNDIPKKKSAIHKSKEVDILNGDNLQSPQKGFHTIKSPKVKESTPTHEGQNGDLKRTLKSQKISAISLNDMDSHEITFNIDMAEFDQVLEDEKESMFQMTYDERIRKGSTGQTSEENSKYGEVDHHDNYEKVNPVQVTHKGVQKSGYHSVYSDQYKAVVTPKRIKPAPQRTYTDHEKIQVLLEQAAYQQNIVLQASQAVNTCLALHDGVSTGSSEEVEAERLLKFSTERRTACLDGVQKLKNGEEDVDVEMNDQSGGHQPCKASLTVSGIRIPVEKKLLQCKNALEPCMYSFICMLKHNSKQMYCTKAVTSEEIKNNCIEFDDRFKIENVKPSFSLDISIFQLKTQLPAANPTNKHKRKTMISKSVLDSPKIKQIMGNTKKSDSTSQALTPGATQGPVFRTSNFNLTSTASVNLDHVHRRKHVMTQVAENSYLTGNIEMNITCNPEYFNEAKGFLTVFEDVGGLGDWLRYWCILDGSVLQYWKYPDDEVIKPPLGSIDLGHCVSNSVTIVPRDICARPHTMQLVIEKPVASMERETLIAVNTGGKMQIKYMLSADTKADKQTWLSTLNESLKDLRAWHCSLGSSKSKKNHSKTDVVMV